MFGLAAFRIMSFDAKSVSIGQKMLDSSILFPLH